MCYADRSLSRKVTGTVGRKGIGTVSLSGAMSRGTPPKNSGAGGKGLFQLLLHEAFNGSALGETLSRPYKNRAAVVRRVESLRAGGRL